MKTRKIWHDCEIYDGFCEKVESLLVVALICCKFDVKFLFTAYNLIPHIRNLSTQ